MQHSRQFWRGLFFILLITALCGGLVLPTASVSAAPQLAPSSTIVVSQVYGGGGNGGATYKNDFIELHNIGSTPVSLNGWSVQYAGAGASTWSNTDKTDLSGTIAPGQYYLIQEAQGAGGTTNLPTPDVIGTIAMSATAGKVALVNATTLLSGSGCPFDASIVDFIGYGTSANCSETAPAPAPSNTTADLRDAGSNSCLDADNNSSDFAGGGPNPRNTASPSTFCVATATPTDTGTPTNTGTSTPTPTATGTPTPTGTATPTGTPTRTPTPTATGLPGGSATSVVISEFRTAGSDEFVELYNPTNLPVDIGGWKISGSNSSGSTQTRATIPSSTLLRSGQYYLVANNSYTGTVGPNLRYGTSISDNGGIGLLTASDQIVDEAGMDPGSAYQEGNTLSPLTNSSQSYERKVGDPSGSCVDSNDNAKDFFVSNSPSPHNSATIRLCNGAAGPSLATTVTSILADSPDPSLVNANVTVTVRVTGGSTTPTGKVNITGANTNCSLTLNSAGTGSCLVKFTTLGSKAIIATYLGDNTHNSSSDGESHYVATTTTIRTPTARPTPLPPPPLVGINEFVPRPGHDWNGDGVINNGDEYIEILNHGVIDVNLSGYSLDDEVNVGSPPYRLPSIVLKPGERHVFYGSETGLLLSDGGDAVRLLKPNGQLADAYNYTVVRFPDQSYCRLPDNGGLDDWNQNCFPTPGLQNSLSGSSVNPPTENGQESLCPILDTLPQEFALAECPPFGNNIWNPEYWDKSGWYDEKNLPESPGKWPLFAD